MPADVITAARRFRKQARARGNPARALLASRYARVVAQTRRDAARLERQVEVLRRNGRAPSREQVAALETARTARARTQDALLSVVPTVERLIDEGARREVIHAVRDTQSLGTRGLTPQMSDIDTVAVMNLVGVADRGPVQQLLTDRAGRDADTVVQHLVDGLVLERDPSETAQLVQAAIDGSSLAAALRLVRTETHRARREAARVVYANTTGCRGWVWVCSLTPTSCGLCWSQHGQHFPLSEPMGTHPNCTCEVVPWFGEDRMTGVELFDALTPAEQDTAIGPAAARAYRAGALTLPDLARTGRHPVWGPVGTQASLVSVLGDRAREFYRPAA